MKQTNMNLSYLYGTWPKAPCECLNHECCLAMCYFSHQHVAKVDPD